MFEETEAERAGRRDWSDELSPPAEDLDMSWCSVTTMHVTAA